MCECRDALDRAVADARARAAADVRALDAARREAARPVDEKAAVLWRVPRGCFARISLFAYYAAKPEPFLSCSPSVLALLEGFARRPS